MSKSAELARLIQDRAGTEPPEYGLILGSGLGHLSAAVQGVAIPYSDLPGFPHAGVSGHVPQLVVGQLEGRRVAVFGGRSHYYESGRADIMRLPLEVLRDLGCGQLILTNAAGSLRAENPPGSLMLLSDHIAFAGTNPLIGETTEARFVPMTDAHDRQIRAEAQQKVDEAKAELERLQTEAQQRLDEAKQQAVDAAEQARVTGILSAFLLAASALIAAAAAYIGAVRGGRDRDEGRVWGGLSYRR